MINKDLCRINETNINKYGSMMKIIKYTNCDDIIVCFLDNQKFIVHTKYAHFKNGNVRNPYDKTVFSIGYNAVGGYKPSINQKDTIQYICWRSMLKRCYSNKYVNKNPTYEDCTVCEEWLNFQNFAKWYDENYYQIDNEMMCLDKDILHKGNKIYSPKTCVFVPQNINKLFTKCNKSRGKCLIGVSKSENKYTSHYQNVFTNKLVHIGTFLTEQEAFNAYKSFKENQIKQIANSYKNVIPKILYQAMYNYIVEDDD